MKSKTKTKQKRLTASPLLSQSNSTVTLAFSFLQMTLAWVGETVSSADWMIEA